MSQLEKREFDDLLKLKRRAILMRGYVIGSVSDLEFSIDVYIAKHFKIQDEIDEYFHLITSKITLENKRIIFNHLIKTYNHEFAKTHPNYHSHLDQIIQHRNIFAHYILAKDKNSIEEFIKHGIVKFIKMKQDIDYENYTTEEVINILNLIKGYKMEINKIIKL